jgi:DNA-binding NtrC family response regulator
MKAHLLVVDDEVNIRTALTKMLGKQGYDVECAENAGRALECLKRGRFELVLTDLKMPDMDGISLLREIRSLDPAPEVILMTAYGTVETAVEAMREGAYDYITKPLEPSRLVVLIEKAVQKQVLAADNVRLRRAVRAKDEYGRLIGTGPGMSEAFRLIDMVAPTAATVLLQGESGVGKELIARTLHQRSSRSSGPLISLNCGAMPESLLETELFGHEKGAFTGAEAARPGKIELAHGGTLFLDEVSEMTPRTQVEFLRVLDQRELRRVGGSKLIHVDIRIVAATNKRLEDEVAAGRFREDLFYRLNVVPLHVPALRERKEDIAALAESFLREFSSAYGLPRKRLSRESLEHLLAHSWPGNVRELRNLMERLVVTLHDTVIEAGDLPEQYRRAQGPQPTIEVPLGATLEQIEALVIRRTLSEITPHRERAAQILGISPRALHYKLNRYGLHSDP